MIDNIGYRARFRQNVLNLQRVEVKSSKNVNPLKRNLSSGESISIGNSELNNQSSPKDTNELKWNTSFVEAFNLNNLLKSCIKGQLLLSSKTEKLLTKNQIMLCAIIVEHFIDNRVNMGINEFRSVVNKIVLLFTKEDKEDYLIESKDKPRGKLPEKFYNTTNALKKTIYC